MSRDQNNDAAREEVAHLRKHLVEMTEMQVDDSAYRNEATIHGAVSDAEYAVQVLDRIIVAWNRRAETPSVGTDGAAGSAPPHPAIPEAVAELVGRLNKVESSKPAHYVGATTNWYRNPDGPEAAQALTSAHSRIAALEEQVRILSAAPKAPASGEGPEKALEDAVDYGIGFIVDGQRISPERVTVCHGGAPKAPAVGGADEA